LLKAWEILTGEKASLISCSRLDAGVDAEHFVANVHTWTHHPPAAIVRSLNGILWNVLNTRISIYDVTEAAEDFHARFHAVGKHYRYLVWHGRGRVAAYAERAWHIRKREMRSDLASIFQVFEGTHDFSAYRSQDCQSAITTRTIDRIHFCWHPSWPELGIVDFWGRGFLKNMIRNLVGNAVAVGCGDMKIWELTDAFEHHDRIKMGPCAPGHGLCLIHVYYNTESYLESAAAAGKILLGTTAPVI
jgi:tRNA pseudouridine38-40 synthase